MTVSLVAAIVPAAVVGGTVIIGTTIAIIAVAIGKHRDKKSMAELAYFRRRLAETRGTEKAGTVVERKGRTPNGEEVVVVRRE